MLDLGHQHELKGRALRVALGLTGCVLVVEVAAGLAAHSLALLSDAAHVTTDLVALGFAWFALSLSQRPADSSRTYGYHRAGILAAMINAALLVAVVAVLAVEAVQRIRHPEPVQGPLVVAAAAVALGINGYIALRLRGVDRDLNVRAALLHVIGDIVASVAVIAGGTLIALRGWSQVDPVLSLGIAALIAWGAGRIVLDAVHILLESVPPHISIAEVGETILAEPDVLSLHDLHVWSLTPEHVALSCHVVVREGLDVAAAEHLIRRLEDTICSRYDIRHSTIQTETCHPCEESPGVLHNHLHRHGTTAHAHEH